MAEQMPVLTDAEVSLFLGAQLFAQALALFEAGAVGERGTDESGTLVAVVTTPAAEYDADVYIGDGKLAAHCTCGTARKKPCVHAAALLIAFVREPDSFEPVQADGWDTDDEFLDEFDGGYDDQVSEASGAPGAGPSRPPDLNALAHAEYTRCLEWLPVSELRALAARRGIEVGGTRKQAILETIAAALSRPGALAAVWAALSPQARLVAGVVALMRNQYGVYQQHLREAMRALDARAATSLPDTLSELISLGVCFQTPYGSIDCANTLAAELPPDADFLPAANVRAPADAPAPSLAFAMLATHAVLALQAAAESGEWRARPAPRAHPVASKLPMLGTWPMLPADLDALAASKNPLGALYGMEFGVPPAPPPLDDAARAALVAALAVDPEQADFIVRLLSAMEIVNLPPGKAVTVDEGAVQDFLKRAPLERTAQLFNAWVQAIHWTEFDRAVARRDDLQLRRMGNMGSLRTYSDLLVSFHLARSGLVLMLRRAPAARWTDAGQMVARARAMRQSPVIWPFGAEVYASVRGQRTNPANAGDWKEIYGAYVDAVLSGPLRWQGLLDLAYDAEGRVAAFRINALGAFLFRQTAEFVDVAREEDSGPALAFTPGGEFVLNAARASAELAGLLTRLCSASSGKRGELLYRPKAEGAARVFESGWDVDTLLGALRQAAGSPVPAALERRLRKWWANFGEVHLYRDVALVELADDYALNELLAGTSLARHLLYRFSPRLIAVRPEGVEELRAELLKKGYTPKVVAQ